MSYKWCTVPLCKNTSITTPDKLFASVPRVTKMRRQWLKLARRDPKDIATNSAVFMCEDHFNMKQDMANYMQYKLGFSHKIIMNKDALPSKFECQPNRKKRSSSPNTYQGAYLKRLKPEIKETPVCSTEQDINPTPDAAAEFIEPTHYEKVTSTEPILCANKGVQAKLKCSIRSKSVQTKTFTKNISLPPDKLPTKSVMTNLSLTTHSQASQTTSEEDVNQIQNTMECSDVTNTSCIQMQTCTQVPINQSHLPSTSNLRNTEDENVTLVEEHPHTIAIKEEFHLDDSELFNEVTLDLRFPESIVKVEMENEVKLNDLISQVKDVEEYCGTNSPSTSVQPATKLSVWTKKGCEVERLLTKNLEFLTSGQKLEIKRMGRHCPIITGRQIIQTGRRSFEMKFNHDYYLQYNWLCGCDIRQKLFCFCCMLFEGELQWSKEGVNDFIHLASKLKEHDNSKKHIENSIRLCLYGSNFQAWVKNKALIDTHNAGVRENRWNLNVILNRIIALSCQTTKDDSVDYHDFSTEFDLAVKAHFQRSTVIPKFYMTIKNELLTCILEVCQEEIVKEINSADYFAVIVDDTSDITDNFQMSIVLRYLVGEEPVDRFFTFVQPKEESAESISNHIKNIISNEKISNAKNKLIAQTYTWNGAIGPVHRILKEHFPYAHFVDRDSSMNLVIAKVASTNSKARKFFANITEICNFFSKSPQRKAVLDKIVGERLSTSWIFQDVSIEEIYELRKDLQECFRVISETPYLSDSTIQLADNFFHLFSNEEFIFWLQLFNEIMPHVYIIFKFFKVKNYIPREAQQSLELFEKEMFKIRDSDLFCDSFQEKRAKKDLTCFQEAGKEVISVIVVELKSRFSFTGHLAASKLLLNTKFMRYGNEFPEGELRETLRSFPFLNQSKLRNELQVLYSVDSFRKVDSIFSLNCILAKNSVLEETQKLSKILITLPHLSDCNLGVFCRIKSFLRNSMAHDCLNALAMLTVEKELIRRMPDFNCKVLEKFYSKYKRAEYIYK